VGQLVEDLLTLARIDERRESKLAPFDLFNLAVDASNDAYATSPDREVSLVGLTDDVAPTSAPVIGDESRMRQVVANLLTNAMRYTPAGTPLQTAAGAPADGLQEPGEVACGPVCHGKQCAPPADGGVRRVSAVGCGVLVSRLATFRVSVGWSAWACGALTSAYVCQGAMLSARGARKSRRL